MAISDKVKVGMVEYGVPATILVEFAAIAVLAWRLGGWVWAVAAMAVIAVLLLFALALCKAASSADPDGADDWWGGVMWMKSKGGHMARNPRSIDGGLAIMVAAGLLYRPERTRSARGRVPVHRAVHHLCRDGPRPLPRVPQARPRGLSDS